MKPRANSFLWGVFLVCLGALFLLNSFGFMDIDEETGMAVMFFSGGLVLLIAFFLFKKKLWTLILGSAGVFIGLAIFIEATRIVPEEYVGVSLFVLVALVFLSSLKSGRKNWWAIIPAGYSLSIAGHILLDLSWHSSGLLHSVIVFGGTGLIFGVIYLLKNEEHHLGWAKYPAGISLAVCALILFGAGFNDLVSRFFLPLMLVGGGVMLLIRSLNTAQEHDGASAPAAKELSPKPDEDEIEKT